MWPCWRVNRCRRVKRRFVLTFPADAFVLLKCFKSFVSSVPQRVIWRQYLRVGGTLRSDDECHFLWNCFLPLGNSRIPIGHAYAFVLGALLQVKQG
ncbi:hypothetical protein TNCV_1077631 [Trichonephila clavipes]|uniref:Uncharacterized protein n=1 Tax=Trichonephila clavipes TaxID=2585209 RepID=A0A8X6RYQ3_TRICX|nr:hypothetical protein TNCV_1077631 [Trichonephila clavipes]